MNEGFEDAIGAILSDPSQMEKITKLASQLMGGGAPAPSAAPPAAPSGAPEMDGKLLGALGRAMSSTGGKSESEALLQAMRPYMKETRQGKLDRALKLTKLFRIAGTVMKEYGGVFDGL